MEDVGVTMPKEIKITVLWDEYNISMSAYSLYREEIIDILSYLEPRQLNLFTVAEEEDILDWISGVFLRSPAKIYIDKVYY